MRKTTMVCGALALLSVGCGDDGGSVDTPEAFVREAADVLCEFSLRCESPNDSFGTGFFCHPAAADELFGDVTASVPHVRFDSEQASRCLDAFRGSLDSCNVNLSSDVCERVYVGTLQGGDSCDSDQQCAPGLYCMGETFEERCAGVCAPTVAAGGSCFDAACAFGLECDETDTCVPLGEVGDPCVGTVDCRDDLYCDTVANECYSADDAEGRPCDPSEFFDACPPPTDCNPTTMVCERYELNTLRDGGESCSAGQCVALHVCADGVCQPQPVVGERCDEAFECLLGTCIDGTCTLQANGGECGDDEQCQSNRCEDGLCVARVALGGSCAFDSDCEEGLVCDADSCVADGPCE